MTDNEKDKECHFLKSKADEDANHDAIMALMQELASRNALQDVEINILHEAVAELKIMLNDFRKHLDNGWKKSLADTVINEMVANYFPEQRKKTEVKTELRKEGVQLIYKIISYILMGAGGIGIIGIAIQKLLEFIGG